MKQAITQNQWNEFPEEAKDFLRECFGLELHSTDYRDSSFPLTIGMMIQALGDQWHEQMKIRVDGMEFFISNNDLCDALYGALKHLWQKNTQVTH